MKYARNKKGQFSAGSSHGRKKIGGAGNRVRKDAVSALPSSSGIAGASMEYKGAQLHSPERSTLRVYARDAKRDVTPRVRTALLALARHFEQNGGLVSALCTMFELYTVGSGLQFIPASENDDWNDIAEEVLEKEDKELLCDCRDSFAETHAIDAQALFLEGEFFLLKVIVNGKRRIQRIENHRVFTPNSESKREGKDIIDGVEVDETGKPIAYYIHYGEPSYSGGDIPFMRVQAEYVFHTFISTRPSQKRGITSFYAVVDLLRDLEDLQHFEMAAAKDAGRRSTVITKAPGGTVPANLTASVYSGAFENSSRSFAMPATESPKEYYEKITGGGETIVLGEGQTCEQFHNERPSAAMTGFWDKMEAQICSGASINRILIFPEKAQGTIVRSAIAQAAALFRSYSLTIGRTYAGVKEWVLEGQILEDARLRVNMPRDWHKLAFCPPRSIEVDKGYASKALIEEYQCGLGGTVEYVYNTQGFFWRKIFKQRAKEYAYAMKIAKEYNVPVEAIISLGKSAEKSSSENDDNSNDKNQQTGGQE